VTLIYYNLQQTIAFVEPTITFLFKLRIQIISASKHVRKFQFRLYFLPLRS